MTLYFKRLMVTLKHKIENDEFKKLHTCFNSIKFTLKMIH